MHSQENRREAVGGRRDSGQIEARQFFPSASSLQPSAVRRRAGCHWSPASARRAFTLTELLVVITIIAILAGLATVAVTRGLDTAKQTRTKVEVDGLDMALKAYKEKYGSYPPCDLRIDPAAAVGAAGYNAPLRAHVARAFPRYDITTIAVDIPKYVDSKNFRPDQALVFWLGGFNPDPTQPFLNLNNFTLLPKAQRTAAFFNFDPARLVALNSTTTPWNLPAPAQQCPSYIPQGSKNNVPYVYYDAATILYNVAFSPMQTWWFDGSAVATLTTAGISMPYSADPSPGGQIVNPESFQIVSAGGDDIYGVTTFTGPFPPQRFYPSGTGYDFSSNLADDDNITSFCNKARLGDAKP
jgi:prepilin-type N-terminal cleavage/methylation domain-containing protein